MVWVQDDFKKEYRTAEAPERFITELINLSIFPIKNTHLDLSANNHTKKMILGQQGPTVQRPPAV